MHLDKVDPADEVGNQAGEDGGEDVAEDEEEQVRLDNNRLVDLGKLTSKLNQLPVFGGG